LYISLRCNSVIDSIVGPIYVSYDGSMMGLDYLSDESNSTAHL